MLRLGFGCRSGGLEAFNLLFCPYGRLVSTCLEGLNKDEGPTLLIPALYLEVHG